MHGEFDKALEHFFAYQKTNYEKEHRYQEINDQVAKCLYAKYAITHPLPDISIHNLGDSINTSSAEYAPLIPADESFLLFTAKRAGNVGEKKDPFGEYYEDIFIARQKNSQWNGAKSIGLNINTSGNDACTGLAADGQKLIIYVSNDTLLNGNFYTSIFDGTNWTKPQLLEDEINSKDYIETSACYSPDGQTIFFSSDMPGGFGGKDIYLIKKLPNGKWGKPYNLGKRINTAYDEDAPFVHPRNNILFFSSQGHQKNMGGYDIFQSSYDHDSSAFSEPENIGFPINTCNDDIFFVLNTNGNTGYFSSERDGGYGQSDIYKVDFSANFIQYTIISCVVKDENENTIPDAKINLNDTDGNKTIGMYTSNSLTGKFILIVEKEKQYELSIYAKDFVALNEKYTYKNGDVLNKKFILKK